MFLITFNFTVPGPTFYELMLRCNAIYIYIYIYIYINFFAEEFCQQQQVFYDVSSKYNFLVLLAALSLIRRYLLLQADFFRKETDTKFSSKLFT
jgi:hypothetical protein